jgi:hypothetical protein
LPWHETWGWLRADTEGWREFHVVGTRSGKDPEARQAEIKRIALNEPVYLRREPKGRKYKNTIAVYSVRDVQVGYIEEKRADLLAPAMDAGLQVEAVSAVTPSPEAYLVGLWIFVREVQSRWHISTT